MPLGQKQNLISTLILILFLLVFVVITSYFLALYLRNSREASQIDEVPVMDLTVLEIEMYDNYYGEQDTNVVDPPVWTVPVSAAVLTNMRNHGQLNHNWAIVKQGAEIPFPFTEGQSSELLFYQAGMVYGDNETAFTFEAPPEPGTYAVICTVEGHYPSMQGKLIVE